MRGASLIGGFAAAAILVACQAYGPATLSEADIEAIGATTQDWQAAGRANDWAAVAALYTEDAVLMPPNAPAVTGPANIQAYFGSLPPMGALDLADVEIDGVGDWAFVRGTYSLTMAVEGMEPIADSGTYLEICRKQADGTWLIYRDIYNSDVAVGE